MTDVVFFTGTRADFGLLRKSAERLAQDVTVSVSYWVAGNHYSESSGFSVNEIKQSSVPIGVSVEIAEMPETSAEVVDFMAQTIALLNKSLRKSKPDCAIILGDRYEALAAAQAFFFHGVPIIHVHAGEQTRGAQDDFIRHAISQLAQYHVVSCERYRLRCVQLGVNPTRVFNLGSPGLDLEKQTVKEWSASFFAEIGLSQKTPFALVTVHPETVSPENTVTLIKNILKVLKRQKGLQYLITYPNADAGADIIRRAIETFSQSLPDRVVLIKSLGKVKYEVAMQHCCMVIGNSSSGIIEAPAFNKPSINVGSRQDGREAARSVIHCDFAETAIENALKQALSLAAIDEKDIYLNPYGTAGFAERFVRFISAELPNIKRTRNFFDLDKNVIQGVVDGK